MKIRRGDGTRYTKPYDVEIGSEPSDDVSQEYLPDDDYEPPLLGEGEIVISGPYKYKARS